MDDDTLGGSQRRKARPNQGERRYQVHVEVPPKFHGCEFLDRARERDSGVVDQGVETAPPLHHPMAETAHRVVIGHVAAHGLKGELGPVAAHRAQHIPTQRRETLGNAPAQARGRPRDDRSASGRLAHPGRLRSQSATASPNSDADVPRDCRCGTHDVPDRWFVRARLWTWEPAAGVTFVLS